jgi:hypothetical protein
MGKWIEVLKTGTFTSSNGEKVSFTETDLDEIAKSNPANDRDTPLVFGHPKDNGPAFGWLDGMKRQGNRLLAKFKDVPEKVKELTKAGHYKKVSVSLMQDKKTLRHVGLLGAVQPAVPGLADVDFTGKDDSINIEFTERKEPSEKEKDKLDLEELKKENEKLKNEKEAAEKELSEFKEKQERSEIETRVNGLVGKKIYADSKETVERLAFALSGCEGINLADGSSKKSPKELFFEFMESLPDMGLETEFTAPKGSQESFVKPNLTSKV